MYQQTLVVVVRKLKVELEECNKKLLHMACDCNDMVLESSDVINFEAKLHLILRAREVDLVGVSMVVLIMQDTTYQQVESLTPSGAATAVPSPADISFKSVATACAQLGLQYVTAK